jgi:hypothetical protein
LSYCTVGGGIGGMPSARAKSVEADSRSNDHHPPPFGLRVQKHEEEEGAGQTLSSASFSLRHRDVVVWEIFVYCPLFQLKSSAR